MKKILFLFIIITFNFLNAQNTLSSKEVTGLGLQKNYNAIAKLAMPAVVSIQVEAVIKNPYQNYANEFFKRFFGEMPERQKTIKGFGSGFVISSDGYVITNYHVIKNAEKITISFSKDKKYPAKVIGKDEKTDVALLKINSNEKFKYLSLGDSDKINVGDIVVAIGNPFNLAHTFTTGVVSAKGRNNLDNNSHSIQNFIQTDVAINPGNSGGPLIDLKGEVIGINSMILSPNNSGNIGIGFSIPINLAKTIVEQLKKTGKVQRGYLGIAIDIIDPKIAKTMKLKNNHIYITEIEKNSPASKSQLQQGDVILSFNNKNIYSPSDLINEVYSLPLNSIVPIKVLRDGKEIRTNIKLTSPNQKKEGQQNIEKLGVIIKNITDKNKSQYNTPYSYGIVIVEMQPNSVLGKRGFRPGDIIIKIDGRKINNKKDFEKATNNKKSLIVYVIRDRKLKIVNITVN